MSTLALQKKLLGLTGIVWCVTCGLQAICQSWQLPNIQYARSKPHSQSCFLCKFQILVLLFLIIDSSLRAEFCLRAWQIPAVCFFTAPSGSANGMYMPQGLKASSMIYGSTTPLQSVGELSDMGYHLVFRPLSGMQLHSLQLCMPQPDWAGCQQPCKHGRS